MGREGLEQNLPFARLQININKLDKKMQRLTMNSYRLRQNLRAARTRTLIQLGGLVIKSGIAEKLGIEIGADLQRDEEQRQKAYTLLGLLVVQVSIPKELEKFGALGKQFLLESQNADNEQEMLEIGKKPVVD